MNPVVGLDPGTLVSGYLVWDGEHREVLEHGIVSNEELLRRFRAYPYAWPLGIEMFQNHAHPMGNDMIETIVWEGRFIESWESKGRRVERRFRSSIKAALCFDSKAKDSWVRQALINKYGPVGTKKNPGPFYEIKEHEWQALGVAAVVWEDLKKAELQPLCPKS